MAFIQFLGRGNNQNLIREALIDMASIPLSRNKFDHRSHPRPGTGQKLVAHYILNGRVVCAAEHRLTADVKFLELPIPIIHRLKVGAIKRTKPPAQLKPTERPITCLTPFAYGGFGVEVANESCGIDGGIQA